MMSKSEACEQLLQLAVDARDLAKAFQPAASEGQIIPVPVVLVVRLCEVLELAAQKMEAVVRSEETPDGDAARL